MAISVTLLSLSRTESGFEATGTVADKAFSSRTIKWDGDLIFKIMEPDEDGKLVLKTLAGSEFTRGERIAVARFLKVARADFEDAEVLSVEELVKLSTKELKALAKSRGLSGYSRKGIRKDDIVAMLSPAPVESPIEVDEAPADEVEAAPEAEIEVEFTPVAEVEAAPEA